MRSISLGNKERGGREEGERMKGRRNTHGQPRQRRPLPPPPDPPRHTHARPHRRRPPPYDTRISTQAEVHFPPAQSTPVEIRAEPPVSPSVGCETPSIDPELGRDDVDVGAPKNCLEGKERTESDSRPDRAGSSRKGDTQHTCCLSSSSRSCVVDVGRLMGGRLAPETAAPMPRAPMPLNGREAKPTELRPGRGPPGESGVYLEPVGMAEVVDGADDWGIGAAAGDRVRAEEKSRTDRGERVGENQPSRTRRI